MPRQAVVCGAANGGVGFALAEYLRLELKLDVCLVDIDAARLARLPATYKSVACDVGSLEQVAALPAKVARAFEPMLLDLAYVVNCSAVFANSQDPVHTAPRSWAMAFRINLVGAFAFQQAFLPLLLASALPSRVIHCGSLAALTGGAR
jgi:NAD(P)-dependent dehydrogenase (short-subunit alcohol dehydrogenase family)